MKARYKPISSIESNLFKAVIQENQNEFDYPWHYHPEFELTYIVKSHGVRYVGNSLENFFEDDLVLLGSNLPHCWINTPGQQKSAKAIVVYLKEEFVNKTWMQSCEFDRIRQLLELSQKGIKFDKEVAQQLKAKLSTLVCKPPFEKFLLLMEILQELALTTKFELLCGQGFSYALNCTNNDRLNAVYLYIEKNYQRKISLGEIARLVNMNEVYFSRYFSKTMKKSVFEFLNEFRINKACKLLIESDKQVAEICYNAGFESIPFFYRQFKKFKNCQPGAYRLQFQMANA